MSSRKLTESEWNLVRQIWDAISQNQLVQRWFEDEQKWHNVASVEPRDLLAYPDRYRIPPRMREINIDELFMLLNLAKANEITGQISGIIRWLESEIQETGEG